MRMLVKDTRSQDGINDKDNDKGSKSRSQSMKEQAYNKEQRERPRPHELNDKNNLIDLMKEFDVRTYLLGGALYGSEANGIIRDPKLELESSRFTFDLVPLSYESVDVVIGENWLLRHKAEMSKEEYEPHVRMIVESLKEEKMYMKLSNNVEAKQSRSYLDVEGIKWVMSRSWHFQEGADDFVVGIILEYGCARHLKHGYRQGNVGLPFYGLKGLRQPILSKELDLSCSGKLLNNVGRLWVVEFLSLERCSTFGKKDRQFLFDELRGQDFQGGDTVDNHDLSRLDNQSIERDRLIVIGFVLNFVKFISLLFGDKEMFR
ncbi:hypothetical protein Tco_0941037 [Tanacetum coccineum]|uniref:Uncharacterized protein n=1 Tax=Tanacetum coccineum TaxID=301880 RepID=A0ABQ5DPX9_9ASTR